MSLFCESDRGCNSTARASRRRLFKGVCVIKGKRGNEGRLTKYAVWARRESVFERGKLKSFQLYHYNKLAKCQISSFSFHQTFFK